jgi:hypothetical protein
VSFSWVVVWLGGSWGVETMGERGVEGEFRVLALL